MIINFEENTLNKIHFDKQKSEAISLWSLTGFHRQQIFPYTFFNNWEFFWKLHKIRFISKAITLISGFGSQSIIYVKIWHQFLISIFAMVAKSYIHILKHIFFISFRKMHKIKFILKLPILIYLGNIISWKSLMPSRFIYCSQRHLSK